MVSAAAGPGVIELQQRLDELTAATEAARQDEEEKRAEAERAAAVLRALETDLSRVEALLVESMAEREGVDGEPVLQGIGYASDAPTGGTAGAVQLRLVDLSDSGEPALVPVDVREPAPDDRGFMGVSVRDGDDGVTIASVFDGSPAEAAGSRRRTSSSTSGAPRSSTWTAWSKRCRPTPPATPLRSESCAARSPCGAA